MMEFNEKLQGLRKQNGLTQEELAQALFVSRAAVSKWESGRGYPSIDSLKAVAAFFGVTVDELLSSSEALTIAKEEGREKQQRFGDAVFGLLDCLSILLLFLPLFGQKAEGVARAVSLLSLTDVQPYLKAAYLAMVLAMILWGALSLALPGWQKHKRTGSFALTALSACVLIISRQPYAAIFLFAMLMIKAYLLIKCR